MQPPLTGDLGRDKEGRALLDVRRVAAAELDLAGEPKVADLDRRLTGVERLRHVSELGRVVLHGTGGVVRRTADAPEAVEAG